MGEHSGENMAEAVWETLTKYGIYMTVYVLCFIFIVESDHYADELKNNRYSRLCWIMHQMMIHLWMASLREREQRE